MIFASNYSVYLESGEYLFDLPLFMPEMHEGEIFTYAPDDVTDPVKYKIEKRTNAVEKTSIGGDEAYRPPSVTYIVSVVP